ncbi:MAG: hypothetical protein JSU77_09710 [Fidelibacterota bacterium]|nr:MAG: hypothetical protein JSU77_09710 [Candidatus Neomarinimicrobiota bacterium]
MMSRGAKKRAVQYSDLILVDLLHLDWKNFFKRYRVDFFGFIIFLLLMMLVIVGTYLIKNIGA